MVESVTESSLSKRLGANIAAQRKSLGMTQAALAEQMKMEPESISRFERGATLPSLATLEELSLVLKSTIADLLAECPSVSYKEEQRLAALLSPLSPRDRSALLDVLESICNLIPKQKKRLTD